MLVILRVQLLQKILFAMPGININAKDSNDQSPLELAFSIKSITMMLLFI
jgi:hypothetical protein